MGQKTHPVGLRLGIVKTWDSRWYAGHDYPDLLEEDLMIRKYLDRRLSQAGVSKVVIERKAKKVSFEAWRAIEGTATYQDCDVVFNYSEDGFVLESVASLQNRIAFDVVANRATTVIRWL